MSREWITVETKDGVATLTLVNPPLNLVTLGLTRELNHKLDALAADPAARVLVVTGSGGKAFCAGSDIKEFRDYMQPGIAIEKKMWMENATYSKLDDFPKPTIAAVNGLAFGGGLEMAVCCDLIVCEEGTRLALPEIKLGVFPGSGGTVRVTRRIGEGRAKEMIFLGEPIDTETALAWGLINRVAPKGTALKTAQALAAEMAQRPNKALQIAKKAVDMAFDVSEDEAIAQSLPLSDQAFSSNDCKEGVRAFFAKEKPRFTHS
ncbi:MAG: enoyl-CoA hydratase/isomerase family protein [Alphaproteobacteria bacterium]|nr:enoyl-CoA hydratase/isomerase family protein [Alphaproteobacteria bacterium]